MSFKCAIFGHVYGDPDVEREREEDGSEVIITIRETQTCERCGDSRVVSENKEVTTIETAADIVGDDLKPEGEDQQSETETETHRSENDERTETVIPDAETSDNEIADGQQPIESTEATDPATDDGVILEDETDETDERDPGEWPEEANEGADDEASSGEWPDEPEGDDEDWKPSIELDSSEIENQGPDIEQTDNAVTVPDGTFYCPECDFTTDVEASSLRTGDFCPDCHRGTLEHKSDSVVRD